MQQQYYVFISLTSYIDESLPCCVLSSAIPYPVMLKTSLSYTIRLLFLILFVSPIFGAKLDILISKAEKGHRDAQFALAKSYEAGLGIKKDISSAIQWYRKSADQGYAPAQFVLGKHYEDGGFLKED